ncbi:TAP42-like protein [Clavulina sp. PMI_390]|nr:TAP42-like protein [Clavulina sp. PMI_390]
MDARTEQAATETEDALSSFRLLSNRISAINLFSPNETFEEISTRDAVYLLLPFAIAEVLQRRRSTGTGQRLRIVSASEGELSRFTKSVEALGVIPDDERKLFGRQRSAPMDPATRRETKIKQFKKEKELKDSIKAFRARQEGLSEPVELDSDLETIAAVLDLQDSSRRGTQGAKSDEEDEDEEEGGIRNLIVVLLRLCWARAHQTLGELLAEREMLQMAPRDSNEEEEEEREQAEKAAREEQMRKGREDEVDETWKLDGPRYGGRSGVDGKGPLLNTDGKVLRPFTITSSSSATREELRAQVFRPDHRLPTMTIDEYLAEEFRRGNVIGPSNNEDPNANLTTDEKLALRIEQDGTKDSEDADLERVRKDEDWAVYKEANRKGAGNTMNRG